MSETPRAPGFFRKAFGRGRVGAWYWSTSAALRRAFEADYYLAKNTDVAEAGIDPLRHYLTHGWREGRDPRRDFSTRFYAETHGTGSANPFVHWVKRGRKQGLATMPEGARTVEGMSGYDAAELAAVRAEFSEQDYLAWNYDVAAAGIDPFTHFMEFGWQEYRDPSPDFSTRFYLDSNPDIAMAGLNPFAHYVLHGRAEGRLGLGPDGYSSAWDFAERALGLNLEDFRRVEAAFDPAFYLEQNADLRAGNVDPLRHFLVVGWKERRDPAPGFSTAHYLQDNADIREAGINPFVHWVLHGRAEGRRAHPADVGRARAAPDPAEIDWTACPEEDVAAISDLFDRDFYLDRYPEVAALGVDPRVHYLMLGWRLGYDPRPDFSTRYYRDRYVDIRRGGANPFLHYCRFGQGERRETVSYIEARRADFRPKVSVILPNYNHAPYLPQRIRSIAGQTYDNLEIIILDDKSPDDSQRVIRETVAELGIDARLEFNEENSGNVFAQWRKGLAMATGDLVWICESDDFCDPDFLEHLIPAFADESVNIAFGRIQFADAAGKFMAGLDAYRERAEAGIWSDTLTRPAAEWFNGAFGVNNVIANVGGCVFRRVDLPEPVWKQAREFRICGDWFLYLHLAGAGQITYEPRAVAYFRQHGQNTSASNFHQRYYYDENMRILRLLSETWGISRGTRLRFLEQVKAQYDHFGLADRMGDFDETFGVAELLSVRQTQRHVQFHFLGFHPGGGELFPINLANAFLQAGHLVSMLAVDMQSINADMRARLDRRIPVYHASHMTARGRGPFLDAAGVSVINSHVASADAFLYTLGDTPIERPFVVALHGSYVAFEGAPDSLVGWIIRNVNNWVYTADRNLEFFESQEVDWDSFVKLPNAMPRDPRPAPFTREDLGIAETDTVFTLVARGIKRKGWRASVEAFRALRLTHGRTDARLLLIGDGEEADNARRLAADLEGVHFLGYQSAINGILRLSDCLILPSRFEGESYPLCLIQALQEHLPVIATDIGEIRSIMTDEEGQTAGLLLDNIRDSRAYFAALTDAMARMCVPETRAGFAETAARRAGIFDMEALVRAYGEVFETAERQFDRLHG